MKKILYLFLIAILLLGCSNELSNSIQEDEGSKGDDEQVIEKDDTNEEKHENNDDTSIDEEEIEPQYVLNEQTWYIEPIDDSVDEKVVLITIDDAPDKYALDMAKILKELNVPAIFFVNGHFLNSEEEKERLKEIHEMGFAIGNHTYSHKSLQDLTEDEQLEEIVSVNDQVEEVIGERPKFFRAPFGQNTDYSKQIIDDEKMLSMNWSYGYDWNEQYMEKDALVDIMLNADELRSGANLLMHDREWTYEALEKIVTGLQKQGYDFVDPSLLKIDEQ